MAVLGGSGLLLLDYGPKLVLAGTTQAGRAPLVLSSDRSGVVVNLQVEVGDRVHAGMPLATLADDRRGKGGRLRLAQARTEVEGKLHRLEQELEQFEVWHESQQQAYDNDVSARSRSLDLARQRAKALVRQVRLARSQRDGLQRLLLSGHVSVHDLQQKDALLAQHELSLVDQRLNVASREHALLTARDTLASWQQRQRLERLRMQDRRARLVAEHTALFDQAMETIVAPADGVVVEVFIQTDALVHARQPLVAVADAQHADRVEAWLPADSAGQVRMGQPVRVRFSGWPFAEYGAAQGRVDDVALVSRSLASGSGSSGETSAYRVGVQLLAVPEDISSLTPGMQARVDVLQPRKALWRWLAQPLRAALARL